MNTGKTPPEAGRPPDCPGLTAPQERAIRTAVEGQCELCSEYTPFSDLVIHRISLRRYREMLRDPSARVLVVCRACHRHIHILPVRIKEQRAIVSRRSFFVRRDLRRAFGYVPKPYAPPENPDLTVMYEDYFYHFPPGSFRLAG